MKKFTNYLLIGLCIPLLASCLPSNNIDKHKNDIKSLLNVTINQGEELIYYNSHGGFHNDGTTCLGIKFKDDNVLNQIKDNKLWHLAPFPSFINNALYGTLKGETMIINPLICKSNSQQPLLRIIKNGYYAFVDRYGNINLDKISGYSVYNFTIGLFDLDNNSFYFCEKDT